MRESFAEARAKAPCLFLIDELDSFGDRASFSADHKDYSVQVVNGLLESLDGVGGRQGVVVIGATNHAHLIDPAITRAGRLDRTVEIPLPDIQSLAQILRFHLKGDLDGVDIKAAAVAARGGTGADCESWVRRARGAARRSARQLHLDDLLAAINEQKSSMPGHLRARVACHEAGHALVTIALSLGTPTSLSLHDWGGSTEISWERRALTGRDLLRYIAQLLAGREAERLIFDDITAGAGGVEQSDLARATTLAAAYEGSYGLGTLGPLWLGAPSEMTTIARLTAIGSRVSKILEHAAQQALRALKENRPALERLSAALSDASYLDAADVTRLVGEIRLIEIEPLPETNVESLGQAEPQGK
jgi:ATP-dependent Zn protease